MLKNRFIHILNFFKVLFAGIISILFLFSGTSAFSTKNEPKTGIKKVVIDAGHGGKDAGCSGAKSKEKHVCLDIALKLGKAISENFPDVEVIYTRKTDVFIELHERANIANKNEADLFICIHANSGVPAAYGSETYVMGHKKIAANIEVAKRENAAILLEDDYKAQYEGFDPNSDESYIIFTLMQNAFMEQSRTVANKIQTQFANIGRRNRGVKQAGFLVLYKTSMPSVLIETGFLTNKKEEDWLTNDANQTKMAGAIYEAFKEYKLEVEKSLAVDEKTAKPAPKPVKATTNSKKGTNPALYPKGEKKDLTGLIFSVQLSSSAKKLNIEPANFKGLDGVWEYKDGSTYKYVVGNEKEMSKVSELQTTVRAQGFKDAFVVAFKDGKRIPVSKARELLKTQQ